MHTFQTREQARSLLDEGFSLNQVSQQLLVARATIRSWRDQEWREDSRDRGACFRCRQDPGPPPDPLAYTHLLGLYLGDGCLSAHPRGVYALRIACCDDYPTLIDECEAAMVAVRPGAVFHERKQGCTMVTSLWKHWVCAFPQHGPGRKHQREITLQAWQQQLVETYPGLLLRGLFHSDGCRIANWATTSDGRRYEGYTRYLFSNASADIRAICCEALDRLGIHYTLPKEMHVSVARRADVALLDEHVGPKS